MPTTKLTGKQDQDRFCRIYAETGCLTATAKQFGVTCEGARMARKRVPEFDAAVKQAYCEFKDKLEREALRRSVEGWEEPVFYRGEQVGVVHKWSDRLMELMLKRHIAEYRDRHQVDMNVTGGVLVVPPMAKDSATWEKQDA